MRVVKTFSNSEPSARSSDITPHPRSRARGTTPRARIVSRCRALSSTPPTKAAWPTRPGSGSATMKPLRPSVYSSPAWSSAAASRRAVGRVDDRARRRVELEARQRAALHEPAARDDDDVVDALLHLAEQVRAHEHRAPLVRRGCCRKPRIHLMPSGSRPLIGSSSTSTPGSPSSVYASDEALPHAERVAAHAAVGELGDADLLEHRRHPRRRQARRGRVDLQVVPRRAAGVEVRVERRADGLERASAGRGTACRRTSRCRRSRARARAAPAGSWSCRRRSGRGIR